MQNESYVDISVDKQSGYLDKNPLIHGFIGLFLVVSLFLFLHFKEARVDVLELDTFAPKYVVSQVDFEFADHEETLMLRQEAARDIGKIYKIKQKEVQERRLDFERSLIHNQTWRRLSELSTFEDMYMAINLMTSTLIQSRFTDARTIEKIKELHVPEASYLIFIPPIDTKLPVSLPQELWLRLRTVAFSEHILQRGSVDYIFDYFKDKSWTLEEDVQMMRTLKKIAKEQIPEKYTYVSAGSRIIDQGEKVTSQHLAMLKAMKEAMARDRNIWHPLTVFGSLLLSLVLVLIGSFYLNVMHKDVFSSNKKLFLLASIVVLTLFLAKVSEYFLLNSSKLIDFVHYPIFVPFAAILISSLINARVAIFTSAFLAMLLSLGLQIERSGGFFFVNLIPAIVAILSMTAFHKRKEVFLVCGKAWLSALVLVIALDFSDNQRMGGMLFEDLSSTFVFMLGTAILVVGLLPLLEYVFGVMTDITLMEFMDPTNELLRRLMIEAPGTYQHSIIVGNLSEAAALAISANGLFCRVACQYHDIGKLIAPQYFTENQQGGINMHQLLTPLESAQVIISHISEGVAMARRGGLPESFISIIKEHHGTTLVYYFYHKQLEALGGDTTLVKEEDFRYMGPKPRSKESAIIMIADSLEAAARSLDDFTEEAVTHLVERLVAEKAEDGQFNDCQLTFEELKIVKKTLIKTLVASSHSRIKYPRKMLRNA
jgi:putative nucleotidyltransferase with HDIG domain